MSGTLEQHIAVYYNPKSKLFNAKKYSKLIRIVGQMTSLRKNYAMMTDIFKKGPEK
jgi:hypothetical protein